MFGFVLGNGISRNDISVTLLKEHGKTYGCNALYRDAIPDVLVATDLLIAEHIQHTQYAIHNRFYTRRPIPGLGAEKVLYHRYSSGPNAVAIAIEDNCNPIYLLGFDMAPTLNNKFNNIYAGTEFYKLSESEPTYPGNWINQLHFIISKHPGKGFIRVLGETSARSTALDNLKNYKTMELIKFISMLNT